jgi:hypothetical protein
MVQTVSTKRPLWRAAGLNGQPSFELDGVDDAFSTSATITRPQNATWIAVLRPSNVNTLQPLHMSSQEMFQDTGQHGIYVAAPCTIPGAASANVSQAWTGLYAGAASQFRKNGTTVASASLTSPATAAVTAFMGTTATATRPFAGQYAELIGWNYVLSAAELVDAHIYVQDTYGITMAGTAPPTIEITLRAVGAHTAAAAAVTPLAPGVPAGVVAGDMSILTVQGKRTAAATAPTVTTPTGWTLISTTHAPGVVAGVDTGSNTVANFYRTDTYTAPSIVTSGFDSAGAVITAYTTAGTSWAAPVVTSGSDTVSGAGGSITGAAGLDVAPLDLVQVSAGLSGDIGAVTVPTIGGMGGATLGGTSSRVNFAVTTGNDSRTLVADCQVDSGTSNASPTFTFTNASATTSHAQFVRLRGIAAGGGQTEPALPIIVLRTR